MVARSPPKQQRKKMAVVVAPHLLSPTLLRETVNKVDKCMARLQELQYTVTGGTKVTPDVNFRTSVLRKHESLRIRNANSRRSPAGKLPTTGSAAEHWRRMSLPAMLLGETMGEVLQATQFARRIVEAAAAVVSSPTTDDPKTPPPVAQSRKQKTNVDNSGLMMQARRRREKQVVLQAARSDGARSLQRAKSKINFKTSPPLQIRECDKENCRYIANRVSPRNRPWARKTVLFPNPMFHSTSPTSHHQKQQGKTTKSPLIARNRQTPHKFLIKSPNTDSSKFQVKIRSPPVSISPTRAEKASSSSMRRSFSPSRLANRLISPLKCRKLVPKKNEETRYTEIARSRQLASYKFLIKSPPESKLTQGGKIKKSFLVSTSPTRTTSLGKKSSPPKAAKFVRSFSPSRLVANRIVASPLKLRNYIHKNEGTTKIVSGNKRSTYWSSQFSPQRI